MDSTSDITSAVLSKMYFWACCLRPNDRSSTLYCPALMRGVSAMFILDDRCNLARYQLTVQSISHYSFQTISSWLRFTGHRNRFGPSGIMCGYFSKSAPRLECSGRNSKSASFFFFASNATTLKRPLIPFHTLICLLFIFISSSTPKSLSPLSLSLLLFTFFFFFFSRAALKQALLV